MSSRGKRKPVKAGWMPEPDVLLAKPTGAQILQDALQDGALAVLEFH